jgi:signal transduction histidine kinase
MYQRRTGVVGLRPARLETSLTMKKAGFLWWRKTVAGKTALGIVVPLLVVFGSYLAYGLTVRRAQLRADVEESHTHHAWLLKQLLREMTKTTGAHDLDGVASAVRTAERYSEVLITDWRGEIRHAKDRTRVGTRLDRRSPECALCHGETVVPSFEARTIEVAEGGTRLLRTVVPLRNEGECQRCHDASRTVNGIAVLEAPMSGLDEAVGRLVRETVLTALALLILSIGAVYAVQHRLVVRPLTELTARARAVEREGLQQWPSTQDDASDEVGELAAAFRHMVERLSQAQRALEDKVRVRTEALSEMGEELERLNARLMQVERLTTMGELAATIAHEIRTPLNALAINVQLLKRELRAARKESGGAADVTGRDTVSILEGEIGRINAVVEEFMRYARMAPVRLRPVDLVMLSRNAIHLLELEAKRSKVELSLCCDNGPVMIEADEERVRQVLINLVINALQAVSAGGKVIVSAVRDGERAVLRVHDDGPGIAANVLETLFKPFVTTKDKGTGLGLAIVARIVKEHHGSVSGANRTEGGACFEVTLPILSDGGTRDD